MPEIACFLCKGLDDLVQRSHHTNFNIDFILCRFASFTRDRKYAKNHANIIELPYSPHTITIIKLKLRHLLAVIFSSLGRITPQMINVTN